MLSVDVLIATDANYLSNLINNMLCQKGYNVCGFAKSRGDLLELYNTLVPEIVVLDLSLDGMKTSTESFNFIKYLLNFDNNMIIIAIGDDITDEFRKSILDYGVKAYLCKPFQPASLWERIERVVKIYILEQENNKTFSRETIISNSDYLDLPKFNQTFTDSTLYDNSDYDSNLEKTNSTDNSYENKNEDAKNFVKFIKSLFNKLK